MSEEYEDPVAETDESAFQDAALYPPSKRDEIIRLYETGTTDIAEIVKHVKARPSYVAQVLQGAGYLDGYFDLYTTAPRDHNIYTRFFRNVLTITTVERAEESAVKLSRLWAYFERLGDRAGQHQACVLALTGMNRARWCGKQDVSEVYRKWLNEH